MDRGCDTKGHENGNVEVHRGCDTKGQRSIMRMLRWIEGVTPKDRHRENHYSWIYLVVENNTLKARQPRIGG